MVHDATPLVMPGLDPGIHASATGAAVRCKDVDGRDEPGHDDNMNVRLYLSTSFYVRTFAGQTGTGSRQYVIDALLK